MIRAPLVALLATFLVLTAGCSGSDDSDDPEPDAPTSAAGTVTPPAAPEVTTRTTIRTVTGTLDRPARAALRTRVGATVDEWFEAAYLGGDYPRTDFDDAFGVFTDGARARAEQDRKLMSNAAVGTTTYAIRAISRRVEIDVLARDGRASAVTVKFRLATSRTGESGGTRDERILGHLYLTYGASDGWQVFGYDVRRGVIS